DIILASSAASIEVSIVAHQPDKVGWELWLLEDAARAEFPVTENSDDTMPIGVGIDITNQQPVILAGSEKTYPPCPILMLLSTDGLLCPFYMLNSIPGMKSATHAPRCPHLQGEREPKPVQASLPAPSMLVPSRASTASPESTAVIVHPPPSFRSSVLPVILPSLSHHPRVPGDSRSFKDFPAPDLRAENLESSSSSDSPFGGGFGSGLPVPKFRAAKFVRFLDLGTTSSSGSESPGEAEQQASGQVRSAHPATTRSLVGASATFPVSSICPTQNSASLELSVSDLEKQLQQYPTLDPVMVGIMEEIALFQKELDDLKNRTARSNFEVGSAKEMSHLRYDAQSLHTFLLEVKELTETLHVEIGILKTVMLEGFAAVEDASTHNNRSMDQNYLQLLRRKPLDPKSEAQLKEIRQLHQYVKFAVQDVNDVLDIEWEQYQEKNKKHKHLVLPEREVLFNALASHHEIITQQDKKINELINSLQNLRIYNQTSKWCVPSDTCLQSDQCWDTELEMLRNVLVKSTLDGAPKAVTPTTPGKLSPVKLSQLRNFLSKRQTPPVRSTAPELDETSHISASLRLDHEGLQTEEQEAAPAFKHAPVSRLPSFPPALITAQSTPYGKPQPAGVPTPTTVPKSTGKVVKAAVPAAEKPATSLPAAQAAAQAALRRQMTSQAPVPSVAEPEQKEAVPPTGVQFLKDTGSSQTLLTVIGPSVPTSETEIGSQIKPVSLNGLTTMGSPASSLTESSSSVSSFVTPSPTGVVPKSDHLTVGVPGEQLHKISSFPGASTGFRFTPPSTSSLHALSAKAQGYPGSAKDAIRSSFGLSNKAAPVGLGADVPLSYRSSKSSSASVSESAITGETICPPGTSCTEMQPAGKPSATGALPEPANAGFGQNVAFGSGVTSPGFSFVQPSSFGGSMTGSVFGQPATASNMFGQPGSAGTVFGAQTSGGGFFSGLGRKLSVDASSRNPFGQMSFGSTEAAGAQSLFGNSGAKTFGFGSATFGSDLKSAGSFSAGSSVASQGFGSFTTPTKPPGGFGAAPVFGSPPGFGGAPTFGGSPAFGGAPGFGGSMSPSAGKVFGEGTAAASAGGFGFGNTANAQTFAGVAHQQNAGTFGTPPTPGFGGQGSSFTGFGSSGTGFGSGFGAPHQSSQSHASGWRG
ncbi:hypothetical protein scyTo_0013582, partial [Scyliorhinus torazame]|nr:hypothetical protein [Scyliorhinus torazame]